MILRKEHIKKHNHYFDWKKPKNINLLNYYIRKSFIMTKMKLF